MKVLSKIRAAFKIILLVNNWPIYFFDFFRLIKSKSITYKLKNGLKLKLRAGTSDRATFNEIWVYRSYFPEGFEIKPSDFVIDVGAHIGIFTLLAANLAKEGRVYSFEPSKDNFNLLKENVNANKLNNVVLSNTAVSSKGGYKDFFISSDKLCSSFYNAPDGKPTKVKVVSLNGLEDSISQINLLKMDCEGAEYDILLNLSAKMLSKIKKISMEYHNLDDNNNVDVLSKFLKKEGFNVEIKPDSKTQGMLYAKRF